ncbi:sensor histidine kinase [Aquibacillus rhizosphaerae]|uniref:histidine kinase n=1 Tax=Aquibacillus rhizosphaerae TaxID=3051431 RepID=A0ABT7LCT9_9BACI|nr:sensor histidine kinase [Aquibacillus sp. LR5S19]MDL4842990.1 sensor histidine kinase [Aquibacillus sp. LR5S19]
MTHSDQTTNISAIQWVGSASFFAIYFLIPLFQKQMIIQALLWLGACFCVSTVFWPYYEGIPNYYVLLLFSYIAGEAVFRLNKKYSVPIGVLIAVSLLVTSLVRNSFPLSFIVLYIIIASIALWIFHRYNIQLTESEARYEALLHEYRLLKRKNISDEKLARQQERTEIAREIHDSVGHKLSNLLMQLEVARMEVDKMTVGRLELLKDLAKESLEETRHAVKTLKNEEIGGITAIISLIRKLEAESFIRIQFSVKNHAFSAPLTSEQMVAVYRAVQEALTNVMRHGPFREATVLFEAPGESVFRFEISNPIASEFRVKEGFGLISMRERVEQTGGSLQVLVYQRCFIIRGTFPFLKGEKGEAYDSNTVS